ncbi:hypothetical protein C8R46DRAFT_1192358 [Mycena filopes]|nr:hypothetical protein C8R46DRAFT_1192358 [Mycena filopes]
MQRAEELHHSLLLAREARNVEELRRVLECIDAEVKGTDELFKTDLPTHIYQLGSQFPDEKSLGLRAAKVHENLHNNRLPAKLEHVRTQWWSCPPVPPRNPVLLSFIDITADHLPVGPEAPWDIDEIPASLDEPFRDAFLRLRLVGNKKYRHPFLPSLLFEALLPQGPLDIRTEDAITVRQVIQQLGQPVVPFVRTDGLKNSIEVGIQDPFSHLHPWETELPDWFPAVPPAHWLPPVPPPSYDWTGNPISIPPGLTPISYIKVPLLKFRGNGRNILPSVTMPPLITSHIFVPARAWPQMPDVYTTMRLHEDAGLIRPSDVITPPISLEQARSLLGRVFRFCRHPLVINEPGKKQKKQKSDIDEFAAAWGWDPDTCELQCVRVSPNSCVPFVLDLKRPLGVIVNTQLGDADPYALSRKCCWWLGLVTTPEDRWVLEQPRAAPEASSSPAPPTGGYPDPDERLARIVAQLNHSHRARIFEVPRGASLLFGDIMLAKAELDFELAFKKVRPGVWISRTDTDGQILLHWVHDGTIDYENIHPLSAEPPFDEALSWDAAGTFSVDSGVFCAITSGILDDDGPLVQDNYNAEVVLEAFMDLLSETSHTHSLAVPGGVVSAVDDSGYTVLLRRNLENLICAARITVV